MELQDPATGRALPSDAIQRVLFIANAVHVYNIPPLTSMRGHNAASWTADPARHIFTSRLRVVETSSEGPEPDSSFAAANVKVDVVLEDPSSGQLFAAAPYTDRNVIEPVLDSSRFFAVTVRDDKGRKAMLGIGFEERSEAFDMAVALQEARRGLGWESEQNKPADKKGETKDYSLKEGETITVNLGGTKFGRRRPQAESSSSNSADLQSFALAPPPSASSSSSSSGSGGGAFALPPPPSAQDVKQKRRSIRDLGFDDGQFGEFA